VRGISEGNSDVTKQATTFDLAKHQQFFIYGAVASFYSNIIGKSEF